MATQRTGGMTAVGVVNIVLGVIGCLFSLLILVGGGFLAAASEDFGAQAGSDATLMVAQGVGLLFILFGLVALATWLMMMISGIGVLMMRSWGRTLAMISGAVIIVLYVLTMISGGFSLMSVALLMYGGLLVGLFMKPSWKMAFSGGEVITESVSETDADDDMRAAA